ncbi:MAG: protein kinase [Gemmatimonadaceae bacterium]|nr:protein kinase [Gemmatimonadaceae bacterium]
MDAALTAALAPRYRLMHPLGAGGMATVYRAEDTRHHRQVAVKVLKPELARALGADRFLREITTTANLRHPNILPLFDSGEVDGVMFYVMPLIEGETLRDRLRRGALPEDEALRITDEVADALHYAHTRGIVHRDIKPENILLEHGHAIVADFGIAQAVSEVGGEKLTMVGLALGTPHYMSPEQGSGDAVDSRSDLYSLACVTYEMLTGAPPFDAPSPVALLVKHVVEPVPSLAVHRPELSASVVAAVARAMAKEPTARFASLLEWRAALKPALAFSTSGQTPVIAPIDKAPPAFSSTLLGRDDALTEAAAHLHAGVRVLSITGYGGTGKTRFAAALQRTVAPAFPDGTAFVSLASVTAVADVMPAISTALDLAEAHGRTAVDALVSLIGARRVLLVLDNLEQVIDAAEDIAQLIARCPALQIVATSRRPLRIAAEMELPLPPLALPSGSDLEALRVCPSVALFVQRAERVKPGFALTSANAAAIAGICRSLDGLPLALELAAARVRILEPAALLQRLDHALDLLTSGDRDLPLRQRTLRATISWSYSLLTADEQRLLRACAVFHEGWALDALEAVCYPPEERWRALDELGSLVEKGLVRVTGSGDRFSLLETIRAFASEQLHASGETERVKQAHVAFFLTLAAELDRAIQGSGQREAMPRARAENANWFAAVHWLLARARMGDAQALAEGLTLCGRLGWYWHIVGLHVASQEYVAPLLALAGSTAHRHAVGLAQFTNGMNLASMGDLEGAARAWLEMRAIGEAQGDLTMAAFGAGGTGYAYFGLGMMPEAAAQLDAAIAFGQQAHQPFLHALFMSIRGMHRFVDGDLEGGLAMLDEARRIQVRLDDCEGGGMALSFLASIWFAKGDVERARALYNESELHFAIVGDKPELARVQLEMGYLALAVNDLDGARGQFLRALRTNDEIGSQRGVGQVLLGLAAMESAAGRQDRALRIAAAGQQLSERMGAVISHPMAPGLTERIEALKASVPRDALSALLEQAKAITPADIFDLVSAA